MQDKWIFSSLYPYYVMSSTSLDDDNAQTLSYVIYWKA